MVKRRCDKNNIHGLMIDGVWCEDPGRIKNQIFDFYKSIFSASNSNRRPRFSNDRVPKLSNEDACSLEHLFLENEVWNAVCGCGSDKAPGPDGFNFKYIKRFWGIIKEDVLKAVVDPLGLCDFRPISLIGNGMLIANETMEFLKRKKMKEIIFKVDFEKAYDSINWSYMMEIMERTRFGSRWRKWVMAYLRSASISILVNGSPTNEFYMGREVPQEVAGLKINLRKSKVYGVGVDGDELDRMAWLSEWKARAMSFGGRLTLVKSILGSLPLYYFSMFRILSSVILALERVRKNFFWGGVGLELLEASTIVMVGRGYGQAPGRGGGVWVDIVNVESWVGDVPLYSRFSRLFHLKRNKDVMAGYRGRWVEGVWEWVWDWIRPPKGRAVGDFDNLIELLENVRSLARWIKERRRAVLGRIPVRVELDKKGIDLDSILCPSFDNVVESVYHCLVLCEKALNVWDRIFTWWGVGPVDAFTLNDMICHRGGVEMDKEARVLWEVVVLVAAYYIWKSRNLRVFKAKNESSSKVFQNIQIKTFE
ncbi:RNA-directed DNA polymerase, eukaryota, reverse transcriptase zinc-binding domain protein [Tanacetum coccineum]